MQIKTINEEGIAKVQLIDPSQDGAVIEEREVGEGHEVTFTAVNAHTADEIQVGEVTETSAGETAPSGEAEPETAEPEAGDPPSEDPPKPDC